MNTYAINCTRGREFEVEQDLEAIGLAPWVPRLLTSKYVKERREAVWYDRPYIHKMIFCPIPDQAWRDVVDLKHVIGKPLKLSRLDIEGDRSRNAPGLTEFKEAVEAEYNDAQRRKVNSEYQCQYAPGQALEMLSGAFEGYRAVFHDVIRRQHDDYARLRLEIDLMGRKTFVEVDPDSVREG